MRVLYLLVAILAVACHSSIDPALVPVIGSFNLAAVDGTPLPWTDSGSVAVRGSLAIGSDGTYAFVRTDSAIAGGAKTDVHSNGKWTISGAAVSFLDNDGTFALAEASANYDTLRVTFVKHEHTFVRAAR